MSRTPVQIVRSDRTSTLSALRGLDVAPLRGPAAALAADRRDAVWSSLEPCDPWPPERVGYGPPSDYRFATPLLPPVRRLDALASYLRHVYQLPISF